jgi:hypothetical protein
MKEKEEVKEKKSAADYFANAYNVGQSKGVMEKSEIEGEEIECNEFEIRMVIVEKIWAAEIEIAHDDQLLHMRKMREIENELGYNQKFEESAMEKERRKLKKKGKIKLELLTVEERNILLNNLRNISLKDDSFLLKSKIARTKGIKVKAILPLKEGQMENAVLIFNSIRQASKELGIATSVISNIAKGNGESVHGIRFEVVEMNSQLNVLWKYLERYQKETEDLVREERERVSELKECKRIKGGFAEHPENIRPRGRMIGEDGHLCGEKVIGQKVKLVEEMD